MIEFIADATAFLEVAGKWLSAHPVAATVVTTVAHHEVRDEVRDGAGSGRPHWWAVARDSEEGVVGAAMRTAPFAPYPAYVLSMPEADARDLARRVHARGEALRAVNGSLPAARVAAEETARLNGATAVQVRHTRLWEATTIVHPRVEGRLRRAREDEAALACAWYLDFGPAAAEQAGHADPHPTEELDEEQMRHKIRHGEVWFWDRGGEPVCIVGVNPPAFGVARIGPVLTPKPHRGRGYASAAVARVAQDVLDEGDRVCLFTEVENPVSNHIYAEIGFAPIEDGASFEC